jgi:hypothetical protein
VQGVVAELKICAVKKPVTAARSACSLALLFAGVQDPQIQIMLRMGAIDERWREPD